MLEPEGRESGAKTIKPSIDLTDNPQLQRSDEWDGNYDSRGLLFLFGQLD